MKPDGGPNFFYQILIVIGGFLHFLGLKGAIKDKKKIERLERENNELQQQLIECRDKKQT